MRYHPAHRRRETELRREGVRIRAEPKAIYSGDRNLRNTWQLKMQESKAFCVLNCSKSYWLMRNTHRMESLAV